jgi:hypothetical protein
MLPATFTNMLVAREEAALAIRSRAQKRLEREHRQPGPPQSM